MSKNLTPHQELLKQNLTSTYKKIKKALSEGDAGPLVFPLAEEMSETAYTLFKELSNKPNFSKEVLKNSHPLTPLDKEFFESVHVIEDMLCDLEGVSLEELFIVLKV